MEFCRSYGEERQWMRENELPVDDLPEEDLFLRLVAENGILREARLQRAGEGLKEQIFEWHRARAKHEFQRVV